MTDSCYICFCEAVDTSEWFFNDKLYEFICPWCVKEMIELSKRGIINDD